MTMLARLIGARRAIELGTFTGYSAICIARGLSRGRPADRLRARSRAGRDRRAPTSQPRGWPTGSTSVVGPAADTLAELTATAAGTYDLAFVDADKTSYPAYYESCLTLLRPGGLIVLDNVLRGGSVLDPAPDDEGGQVIAALNERIAGDERVDVAMLGVADGITLARKR